MEITELINQTEKYILVSNSEHYKSLAEVILQELKNIDKNENYIVPSPCNALFNWLIWY